MCPARRRVENSNQTSPGPHRSGGTAHVLVLPCTCGRPTPETRQDPRRACIAEFLQHRDSHYTRRCGFFLAAKANDVIKKVYTNERVTEVPPDTTAFFKNLRLELVRSASVLFSNRMVHMEALGRIVVVGMADVPPATLAMPSSSLATQ